MPCPEQQCRERAVSSKRGDDIYYIYRERERAVSPKPKGVGTLTASLTCEPKTKLPGTQAQPANSKVVNAHIHIHTHKYQWGVRWHSGGTVAVSMHTTTVSEAARHKLRVPSTPSVDTSTPSCQHTRAPPSQEQSVNQQYQFGPKPFQRASTPSLRTVPTRQDIMVGYTPLITRDLHTSAGVLRSAATKPLHSADRVCR